MSWVERMAVAGVLLVAGCAAPGNDLACPETDTWARVEAVEGASLRVVLEDSSEAVLHVADSEVHALVAGTECYASGPEQVRAGQEIRFDVDAWAESSPPQAWPDHVVILG